MTSHIALIEYNDYRNFINFVNNKYSIPIQNSDPFEFFRIDRSNIKLLKDRQEFANNMFAGRMVSVPTFDVFEDALSHYSEFEAFTAVSEVNNLSLWALSCLKKLSYDKEVRLGKELQIAQNDNPRDGRLDVAALCDNNILVLETKVDLITLLSEKRYKQQIPAYIKETSNIVKNYNEQNGEDNDVQVILLIGGDESALYPINHPDCTTGQVGDITNIFYDSLKEYGIKFLTANALWSMATYSEIMKKKLYWNNVIAKVFSSEQNVGLLSGGIAYQKNNGFELMPLALSSYS